MADKMPPATPHRFLPGRRRQAKPRREARPAPTASHRPERGDGFDNFTPQGRPPRTGQPTDTPHLSVGRHARPLRTKQPASPDTPLTALCASIHRPEDVQSTGQEDGDDEMLQLEEENVTETAEKLDKEQRWTGDMPHSPKRRRLDPLVRNHGAFVSPVRPAFKIPTTPASHSSAGPNSFARPSSVTSSVADDCTSLSVRHPVFLRSSFAPLEPLEPLPEAFSPHRRGDKFVNGGLAATLQHWVFEIGQAAAQSRRGQGYLRGEDYVHKVKVHAVTSQRPILVQGRQLDGKEKNVLLVVDSKQESSTVLAGSVVGVRAPVWELEIGEAGSWIVGVDWKVLSS